MVDSVRKRLMAAFQMALARPLTTLTVVAGVVIFLLLLGGNAGVAVLVSLLVVPTAVLFYLTRLDLYEREPWALLASVVGAGALVGLLGGLLSSFVFERFWFSDSRLNLGAIGFSGISANGEGSVPFGVVLLGGLLIPVLTGAALLGGPVALRRWPVFRNEITDGMTLGGLGAAGFATVSSFVYFWPSAFDDLPDRPVSQWTALLAGIVVIRPVVLILAGSLLGIAAWQYLSTKDIRSVLVPGIAGAFGWLALPLGSLFLAQSGAVAEFVWYAVVLIVVGVLFRQALGRSLATDRQVLAPADGAQRVVCPNCHRVTPDGSFCSFCRSPLHPEAPTALGSASSMTPVSMEPLDGSSADQPFAASDPAGRGPSVQTPSRARETVSADDSGPSDAATGLANDDAPVWLEEVAAEPEADALDDPDRSSAGPEWTAPADATPEPALPRDATPSSETLPTTARFKRPQTDDGTATGPEGKHAPEPISVRPSEGDTGSEPTGLFDEPNGPTVLRDWSRRSEPIPTPDGAEPDDPRLASPPSTPARPMSSPWSRLADPSSEPVSGLKWPTGNASSIDRPANPSRVSADAATDGPDADTLEEPSDRGQPTGQPEDRPLTSSSGRWFDTSSIQRGSMTTKSAPSDEPSGTDDAPEPDDSLAPTIDDASLADRPTEPIGDGDGVDPADEPAPPSGLRWYRQDVETGGSAETVPGFENEPLVDAEEWVTEQAEPLGVAAIPPDDPDATPETEGRPGIWRSFTRQGRAGTPRAPRRDQGPTDDET